MFLTNAQSRFASPVFDSVRGPSACASYLTASLFLCSSTRNARGKTRVLEVQGSETETRELMEGKEQKSYKIIHLGKINDFVQKGNKK